MNRIPNDVLHLAVNAYEQNLPGTLYIDALSARDEPHGYNVSYHSPRGDLPQVHLDASIDASGERRPHILAEFYEEELGALGVKIMLTTHYCLEDGVLTRSRSLMHQDYQNYSPGQHPDDYTEDDKVRSPTRFTAAALAHLVFSRVRRLEQTKTAE